MENKCKCVKTNSLKGELILNKTYIYIKDDNYIRYPYYIYDEDNWISTIELEVNHIASVSEKFFNEHFVDIKKLRTDKLKKLNEK